MDILKMNKFLNYKPIYNEDPQHLLEEIVNIAKEYIPKKDIKKIYETYNFAKKAHGGFYRHSGEPYIVHSLKATIFLMEIKPDIISLQACILHDIIEDTDYEYEYIKKKFGKEIADLCEGLEKVSKIKYKGEDRQIETLKKTFIAMAKDLRVIFIKLADRIHNIQTLHYHPKLEKRIKIAQETMKIYVSLARKLGLYHYQLYLENGSFRVLNKSDFENIFKHLKNAFGPELKYKEKGVKIIKNFLNKEGIKNFEVEGRLKSPRRIYEKMIKKYQSKDISNVMDVLAYRIIVSSVSECYMILGVIHKYYTPLINKIKDYIAIPKFNGYRSIHTTILGVFPFPIEVQIRTKQMDEIAKYGVAAHFDYSEKNGSIRVEHNQTKWIKNIQELVNKFKNENQKEKFKDELNIEVLEKGTFLYTPKGDIIELPVGSTVLDFAFRVHTNIGLRYKNAFVNGHIKPINFVPKSGDIVRIETYKTKFTASKHRLEYLHTPSAKAHLNRYLKLQQRRELLDKAKKELNKKLLEYNLPKLNSNNDLINKNTKKEELEKKLLSMLDNKSSFSKLIKEYYPQRWNEYNLIENKSIKKKTQTSVVEKQVIVDFDKTINYDFCLECKPTYGDKLIAKIGTDGFKIHNIKCKALKSTNINKLYESHWEGKKIENYSIELEIYLKKNDLDIIKIMSEFSQMNLTLMHVSVDKLPNGDSKLILMFNISNPSKIGFIIESLKNQGLNTNKIKKRFI